MSEHRYTIPAIPPSNNRYIGRNNTWEYRAEKSRWADLIAVLCRPRPPQPLETATVRITYYFPDRRRRDPDNYSGKMLLDGLVRSGIIRDDCFDAVELVLVGKFDRQNPRTEIEIIQMEGDVCTQS